MQDSVRDDRLLCISQKLSGCNEGPLIMELLLCGASNLTIKK
jgi:hypothetical protein